MLTIMTALGIGLTLSPSEVICESRSGDWYRQPSTRDRTMNASPTTVLFTDTEGSTEFSSARGDEMAVALVRAHEEIVRVAAATQSGRVVKSTGDGFLVVFPSSG